MSVSITRKKHGDHFGCRRIELLDIFVLFEIAILNNKLSGFSLYNFYLIYCSPYVFQIFDMALAPVLIQLVAENPSPQHTLELRKYFT